MAFTKLVFEKDWTRSEDFPTHESSEVQVRADMQYHPNALRNFINALLDALESQSAAASLGAADEKGAAATLQTLLDSHAQSLALLRDDVDTLAGGGVPLSAQSVEVKFQKASWLTASDGVTLTIAQRDHKRNRSTFGYNIYQLVNNIYQSGTWGAAATRVTYNSDGSIKLTADQAYTGKIVFFGL